MYGLKELPCTHVPLSETAHTQQPKTHKLPHQFIWDNDSMIKFTENLKSVQTQQKLQYLINSNPSPSKEGVDRFASKVEDLIMHAHAKKSMKIKRRNTETKFPMSVIKNGSIKNVDSKDIH
jgi:hypothetical protein